MRCAHPHENPWWHLIALICLFLAGAGIARAASTTAVDVMLVIDNSGSMRKNDPQFLTPKTVRAFLERLPESAHVGMVLFDQRARLLQPLTDLSDAAARQRLNASLKKIDYRGKFTDSAAGIERAVYELKTAGRSHARQSIIFLTDGIVDTGNRQKDAELSQWLKSDLANECSDANIRILGVAFTEDSDFPLIQALASRTGGAYFRATHAEDIADVLNRIQALLPPPQPVEKAPPAALPEIETEPPPVTPAAADPEPPAAVPPGVDEKGVPDEPARSFWKFYFPLILVILVLTSLIVILVFKLFSRPAWLGGQQRMPMDVSEVIPAGPPPGWELQDLGGNNGGIMHFEKERVTVGRDEKNDLTLPTPTVSNLHATVDFREDAFFLEDQRSTNGTRLNGHLLRPNQPVQLKSGDRISFANLDFKFVRLDQIISGDTIMLEITAMDHPVVQPGGDNLRADLHHCLQAHLSQVRSLGEKYDEFVDLHVNDDIGEAIVIQACENMERTAIDHEQHCSPLIRNNAFYVICTLPVDISAAVDWFGEHHGGYTKFISKWIHSEAYDVIACDQFCIITFGMGKRPWISLTVVPTHDDPDPVEIMSVNFLSEAEKNMLGLDFDIHGRVI